uniref:Uncharacterized protein n=1 Tax=Candidatus Kentrum sp. LFY TaxID=2126342 RepID=A0A450U5M2_9GAMM|nr:MAG: hypothetical protein BECKLFY1418B_GA0070995_100358 [Candidatus Kentron sp. LFY]
MVPEQDLVVIDPDPGVYAAAVILVGHGIHQGFPQGLPRYRIGFDPLYSLVGDQGLQILGQEQIQGPIDLGKEVAVDLIVIANFTVGLEIADLRLSSSRLTCRGTVPVPKPLQKGKSNDTLPIGLRRALQFGPSRLFTSRSAWQMCRVPRNTDFALPMPTHAVPVRAQASPSMRK